jgi:hypothetical protein
LDCALLPFVFECSFMASIGRAPAKTGQTRES